MLAAPSIPPTFGDILNRWSVRAYGRKDQLRPAWDGDAGVWTIEIKEDNGAWKTILVVTDWEKAVITGNRFEFRDLDDRVVADLWEAYICERWDTGDVQADRQLESAYRQELSDLADELRRSGDLQRMIDLTMDSKPELARVKAICQGRAAEKTRLNWALGGAQFSDRVLASAKRFTSDPFAAHGAA